MADNTLNIRIGTDLSELEADSKRLGSALDGAARGGIAGFEKAQQKVIDLTKQLGELRNALLQTNDPARQAQLNAALSQTSTQLQAAKTQMRGMSMETREANEKAQMLAAQFGVRLPQGLGVQLARMPAVQAAMAAAFNATIVLAVLAAIVAVIPKLDEWMDRLRGIKEAAAGVFAEIAKANEVLGAFGKPGSVVALTAELDVVAGSIRQVRTYLESLQRTAAGPYAGWFDPVSWYINRKEIDLTGERLTALTLRFDALGIAIPVEKIKERIEAIKQATERLNKELLHQADFLYTHWEGLLEIQKQAVEAEKLANETITRSGHEMVLQQNKDMEDQVRIMEEHGRVFDERIIRQSKEAQEGAKDAARAQEQMLEATAGKIESFIDRVFLTARSLSDVFHQFLMQTLGSFVKWISQMLAHWLTGIRQATAGAGGGGGGILGSLGAILGGVFGIGGGTSAMAAGGGGWAGQAGQLALPVGMGGMALPGGGEIPSAVGGAAQGTLGQLAFHPGQFLAGLPTMLAGMGILGGIGLAGGGGPGQGALGGALAGGGIGLGLYSLGLLGGPWGLVIAGIGAAIGGLVGVFRRGGQKKKASGLQQGFEFAANDLFDQFKQFKIDYDSALAGMQELIAQGQQTLTSAGLGRWGRQGAEGLTRTIQDEIRVLEALQKQREARATLMAGMTIPEFAAGGPIGYRLANGGILALVHQGEFVMRREAVDTLGQNFLTALNRAPRFALGGPVSPSSPLSAGQQGGIHIHGDLILYPAKDMSDREAMQMVIRGFKRAVRDGAL